MKHISSYITSALFLCFTSIWAIAQDTLPRIGSTIDSSEREYFGLFPTIPGFTEAKASMNDSGISFQIRYFFQQKSRDTVFSLQQLGKAELIRLIDNFETVADVEPPIDYKKIQPVGNADITYPRYNLGSGSVNTFVTHDNRINRMQLLYAADSALLLLPVDSVYRWRSINSAQLLRLKDIRRITNNDYWWGGWVVGAGLAINGMLQLQEKPSWDFLGTLLPQTPIVSIFATKLLTSNTQWLTTDINFDTTELILSGKSFSSQSIFPSFISPELLPINKGIYTSTIGEFATAPNSEWKYNVEEEKTIFRIWSTVGYLPLRNEDKYTLYLLDTIGDFIETHYIYAGKYAINFGGDYNISTQFRLGMAMTFRINTDNTDIDKNKDPISHYSPSIFISYMLIPQDVLRLKADYQIFMGIAADIVSSTIEKNNLLYPFVPPEKLFSKRLYSTIALIFGSSFSFNLSNKFSLLSRLESHLASTIMEDETTVGSPYPLMRLSPHSLSFSFTQASVGLQYSF